MWIAITDWLIPIPGFGMLNAGIENAAKIPGYWDSGSCDCNS